MQHPIGNPSGAGRIARRAGIGLAVAAVLGVSGTYLPARATQTALPPPVDQEVATGPTEKAVFAGGCFWGVQAVFQHVDGVTSAVSGYAGGTMPHPGYYDVGGGETGHAESVEVTFDPKRVSYATLLQVFFSVAHDPTQLNRQGPDQGTQYRSAVFPTNPDQARVASHYVAQLDQQKSFSRPIVTEIKPLETFWPAETYHQDYATRHPNNPYIAFNDLPKVEALKTLYPSLYRDQPVLVAAGVSKPNQE